MTPDDTTPAEAIEDCAHVYVAEHQPGHSIYWLRFCMLCRKPDWDNVDEQVAEVAARAAADRLQADINLAIKVHAAHCLACESPDRDRSNEHPPGLVLRGSFADLLAAQDTPPTTTTEETP